MRREGVRRRFLKAVAVVAAVVGAGALVLSCGDGGGNGDSSGPIGSYAGRISDSDAFIAVVAGKTNIVVWVGDGPHKVGIRFTGPRLGNGFDMTLPIGVRVAGSFDTKHVAGALTVQSNPPQLFTADATTGAAGLYAGVTTIGGKQVGLAWVVLNDGQQRGTKITDTTIDAAPQLDTATRTVTIDGTKVNVSRTAPGDTSGTGFGGGFGGGGFGGQFGFGGGGFGTFGQFGGQIGAGGGQFGQVGGGGGKVGFGG